MLDLYDGYTIGAVGEGEETFGVTMERLVAGAMPYGATELEVQQGSVITFTGDSPENMVLHIDLDGDGEIDQSILLTPAPDGVPGPGIPIDLPPRTGDDSPPILWLALALLVSAGGALSCCCGRGKRRASKIGNPRRRLAAESGREKRLLSVNIDAVPVLCYPLNNGGANSLSSI